MMLTEELPLMVTEQRAIASRFLNRYVIADFYLPKNVEEPGKMPLLLINDGQQLGDMNFLNLLHSLIENGDIPPMICCGIHAGKERLQEYGICGEPDYEGRGAKASFYQQFVLEELFPFIHHNYGVERFSMYAFAGFSLGGLMALDMVLNNPDIFSVAGVFSGSLWWRNRKLDEEYQDGVNRIMHQKIRNGSFERRQKFYFTTGSLDETADRNNNGIIDSMDDTQDLIEELVKKGFSREHDISYINYEDGKHDVETWKRAMPGFLIWIKGSQI